MVTPCDQDIHHPYIVTDNLSLPLFYPIFRWGMGVPMSIIYLVIHNVTHHLISGFPNPIWGHTP